MVKDKLENRFMCYIGVMVSGYIDVMPLLLLKIN